MKKPIIYTKNHCPACVQAKKWFEDHRIEYEERHTSCHKHIKEVIVLIGNSSMPVICWEDEIIEGFSPKRLEKLLK